jgi:hypothetical protein
MPFSWIRVSSRTSRKIRDCMGESDSKVRFEECLRDIVASDGGAVERVWFELNGKFAHAHVYWETLEQKAAIVFDVEADQVIDLASPQEIDEWARERRTSS